MITNPKYLLIAERMNMPELGDWLARCERDPSWWIRVSTRIGAFRPEKPKSRDKLRRVGVNLDDDERWDSMNLLPPAPSCVPWEWDSDAAQVVAGELRRSAHERYSLVALCGRRVQRAFGAHWMCDETHQYAARVSDDVRWIAVPHPSGLNRFWNDDAEVRRVRMAIRRVLDPAWEP